MIERYFKDKKRYFKDKNGFEFKINNPDKAYIFENNPEYEEVFKNSNNS